MASPVPSLISSGSSSTDGTSASTASVAFTNDDLWLIAVSITSAAEPPPTLSLSGGGITWVAINNQDDWGVATAGRNTYIFRGRVTSGATTGAVTITASGTASGFQWHVIKVTGADTTGTNGSGAIVQSALGSTSGVNTLTLTLTNALANAESVALAAIGNNDVSGTDAEAGATELGDTNHASPGAQLHTQYKVNDTALTATTTDLSTTRWGGVIIEIKAASGTVHTGAAVLAGVGSMTSAGTLIAVGASVMPGVGSFLAAGTVVGGVTHEGAAVMAGVGSVAAAGRLVAIGVSAMPGVGSLAAVGRLVAGGQSVMAGVGSVNLLGGLYQPGAIVLTGIGTMTPSGSVFTGGTKVRFRGLSGLVAEGEVILRVVISTPSLEFADQLKRSHVVIVRCEVLDQGDVVMLLDGIGGNVSVDGDAAVRRRGDLTITDFEGELTPALATDLLAPFGNELKLYRGIRFPDGSEEMYSLGVFGISEVGIADTGESLEIKLEGFDRARRVQRARFTDTYSVLAGTPVTTAITEMLSPVLPEVAFSFLIAEQPLPLLIFETGDDRWEAAQRIATSIGAELFFDREGVCVMRSIPDPLTSPVAWQYHEGSEATILYVERALTDEYTYNHVVVSGESPDNEIPVRAEAKDEDSESPTYYLGDYGDVVYFYTSEMIHTEAQAQEVADGLLRKVLGATEQVRFNAIVNPAHEAGDIIEIKRGRARVDARYVLESFNVPLLVSGSMNATTKRRKI